MTTWISINEAAELLGVPVAQLYVAVRRGALRSRRSPLQAPYKERGGKGRDCRRVKLDAAQVLALRDARAAKRAQVELAKREGLRLIADGAPAAVVVGATGLPLSRVTRACRRFAGTERTTPKANGAHPAKEGAPSKEKPNDGRRSKRPDG